jgi:hypothetical protein
VEKDYIKFYNDAVLREELICEAFILKIIIKEKKEKNNFKNIYKIIQGHQEKLNYDIVFDSPWDKLTDIYRYKHHVYDDDFLMDVIPDKMLPLYSSFKLGGTDLQFDNYLEYLARYNAHYDIYKCFDRNYALYNLMFRANDFLEFKIIGCDADMYNSLFKKFNLLLNGYPAVIDSTLTFSEPVTKKEIKNFCPNKENCRIFFESKDFYNYLVFNDFIDSDFTSFIDFKNVFIDDFVTNKSIIRFHCNTKKASVFLNELQIRFTKKLTYTNIEYSKKFKTQKGTLLSRKNLTESVRKSSIELRNEVKEILDCFQIC